MRFIFFILILTVLLLHWNNKSFLMQEITLWPVSRPTVHFSIDDVRSVCYSLSDNYKSSIFEDSTLAMLRQWHNKYGIKVSLYVQGDFTINSKYSSEIVDNSDWLKFGYHAEGAQRSKWGMFKFHKQVYDSIGNTDIIDNAVRIDYYHADYFTCIRYKMLGYKYFFTADDWSYNSEQRETNYYLTSEQSRVIENTDVLYDPFNNLTFCKTDLRIERIHEIYGSVYNVEKKLCHNRKNDLMVIFTHERFIRENEEIIDSVFSLLLTNGYNFDFLD